MASVELIFRLLLAAMLLIAASGKLANLQASRDTVLAFGLPARLASLGGTALPFVELATAVALLPTASARWGSLAAVLLLAVFTSGVAYALSQGRTPDCNCFGVVSSEQISNRTLLRNGALIVLAALSIWKAPGSSLTGWTSNLDAANVVAVIAALGLALALVGLAQARHALTAIRFDLISLRARSAKPGLQPGDAAPDFRLPILGESGTQSLEELRRRGTPALLVFASQSCGPCMQMLPDLVKWSETVEERLSIVLVESAVEDPADLAAHINQHGRILTLLDEDRSMADAYAVAATPTGILLEADGTIAAPQAQGAGNIEGLLRTGLESHAAPIAA